MARYRNLETGEIFHLADGEELPPGMVVQRLAGANQGPMKPVGRYRVLGESFYRDRDANMYEVGSIVELLEEDGAPGEGWQRVSDDEPLTGLGQPPLPAAYAPQDRRVRWRQPGDTSSMRDRDRQSARNPSGGVES